MATEKKYSLEDLFMLLGQSLILLQDKQISVSETNNMDELDEKETKTRVSLVDYIVRAVGDELVDRYGETEETVRQALDSTEMDFEEIAYPKEKSCVAIYNDIY